MNKTKIRQQGFNDHGGGYKIWDNPYESSAQPEKLDLWEEGWKIREAQAAMFDDVEDALDDVEYQQENKKAENE